MKPLTVEQLKALEVGDWVWIVDLEADINKGKYYYIKEQTSYAPRDKFIRTVSGMYEYKFNYSNYGTKWLAYKNKEEAEDTGYGNVKQAVKEFADYARKVIVKQFSDTEIEKIKTVGALQLLYNKIEELYGADE